MNVIVAVTRPCNHCPLIENELRDLGVAYVLRFLEDHPELAEKYGLRGSPNIIVDEELVFRGMPPIPELREYFENRKTD
jgi:glutaredoxin